MRRALAAALLTVVIAACADAGNGAPPGSAGAPDTGSVPDFTVTTFAHGEFSLKAHAGTPVVLNFWESW